MNKKWQYDLVTLPMTPEVGFLSISPKNQGLLSEMGGEGWEIASTNVIEASIEGSPGFMALVWMKREMKA